MLDDADRRRRQAARKARDARHRSRVKACRAVYQIEIGGEVLDLLLKARWISEEALSDKRAVERALSEMLAASARL